MNSTVKGQTVKGFKEIIYVALLAVAVNLLFALFGPYPHQPSAIYLSITFAGLLGALLLERKGYFITAKLTSSVFINLVLALISIRVGLQSGSVLYYFPFIIGYLYLFRNCDKPKLIYFFFAVTTLTLTFILIYVPIHPPNLDIPESTINAMLYVSFIISFLLTAYMFFSLFHYQHQLYESSIEQEKKQKLLVMQSVMNAQEAERRMLVQNLRNNVNQNLASGKMLLQDLADTHQYNGTLLRSLTVTQQVMHELNTICNNLNAGIVEDLGLEEGLTEYIANFEKDYELNVELAGDFATIETYPVQDRLFLFRMIQDYLLIHAANKNTRIISIQLKAADPGLSIHFVQDDEDFTLEAATDALLLNDLRHRVEYYRGSMNEFPSSLGRETILNLRLN